MILALLFVINISTFVVASVAANESTPSIPQDWRVIEQLAEQHPFIVALLSKAKTYLCTGSIIDKRTILTSGSCVTNSPKFVATSSATFGRKNFNRTCVLEISHTMLHGDFTFEMRSSDNRSMSMHSNIGLVFVRRPILEIITPPADIGNFFASELTDKALVAVGFGWLFRRKQGDAVVVQHQLYNHIPCTNPRWYYCICGTENKTAMSYFSEFGNGGPVMYGSQVVAVAASPCGSLFLPDLGHGYNIFTVIGPYIPWIKKSRVKLAAVQKRLMNKETRPQLYRFYTIFFIIMLGISKVLL